MEKLLRTFPGVEMHHEYLCTHVQPLAVRYYMGFVSLEETCEALKKWHGAAIYLSDGDLWGDSSNKLSWLIEGLNILFPRAKFIYLVRDGRKVVSSFYHKLDEECYNDRSTKVLQGHIDDPARHPAPPPEKKYWWNLPRPDTALAEEFRHFDRFQRICFHWGEVNRFTLEKLEAIPPARKRTYKLEELVAQSAVLKDLLDFLGLPYSEALFQLLKRPHNVNRPEDHSLTPDQLSKLMAIAGDMMRHFGYEKTEEYRMVYDAHRTRS